MFHKLVSIKLFDKNPDDVTISIFFNKSISALCDYEYVGRTPEVLDECTCFKLLNYLVNPVSNLCQNIKSFERMENKGVGFTAQHIMDAVLEYAKVQVTINS